jgi:hypothetical protein
MSVENMATTATKMPTRAMIDSLDQGSAVVEAPGDVASSCNVEVGAA